MTAAPDLSAAIRATIIASSAVTGELPAYLGSWPVFTRVPVPVDAPYPMVVTPGEVAGTNEDGTNDYRPVLVRDVSTYGLNDTAAHARQVDRIAQAIWGLFHTQRGSIVVSGWSTIDVRAALPVAAPTDNNATVGRRVELTVRLARNKV